MLRRLKVIKLIIALSILINPGIAFADDVVYINKGTPSPTDGYLFSPAKTQDTKNKLLSIDNLNMQNASYQKSIDLYKSNESSYQKQLDLYSAQNTKLISEQQSASSMTNWERAAWFFAGVLATGAAFTVASKTIKAQ